MPRSIKARLNGNSEEALEYTRIWGRYKSFEHFKEKGVVNDWKSWVEFLEGETGDPSFGLRPELGGIGNQSWADDFLDAIEKKFDWFKARLEHLESENRRKDEIIESLMSQEKTKAEPRIREIMEKCLGDG